MLQRVVVEPGPSVKKGVKTVDMSIHDVSGVVGWCLEAYIQIVKWRTRVHDPATRALLNNVFPARMFSLPFA